MKICLHVLKFYREILFYLLIFFFCTLPLIDEQELAIKRMSGGELNRLRVSTVLRASCNQGHVWQCTSDGY